MAPTPKTPPPPELAPKAEIPQVDPNIGLTRRILATALLSSGSTFITYHPDLVASVLMKSGSIPLCIIRRESVLCFVAKLDMLGWQAFFSTDTGLPAEDIPRFGQLITPELASAIFPMLKDWGSYEYP